MVRAAVSFRTLLFAVATTLPVPVSAGAQSIMSTIDPPVGRSLSVDFSEAAFYDSNVARSSQALADIRGLKLSDEVYTPEIELTASRPIGREELFLTGNAGYNFYQSDHILNRGFEDVKGGVITRVARCSLTAAAAYSSFQSDLQELVTETREGLKNTQQLSTIEGDASCPLPSGIVPKLTVGNTWSDNSSKIEEISNYRSFYINGSLGDTRLPIGATSAFVQYNDTTYPDREGFVGASTGYQSIGGGLSIQRPIGRKIALTASLAFTSATTSGEQLAKSENFDGPTYSADLKYNPTRRVETELSYTRAIGPASLLGATYSIENTAFARLDYMLGQKTKLSVGVNDVHYEYKGEVASLFNLDLYSREQITSIFSTAEYELGRRLSVKLDLRYEQRRTDVALFNYDDGRVGLTLREKF